jgi:predicted TIM-barrel fold metal-dependent hydrolase
MDSTVRPDAQSIDRRAFLAMVAAAPLAATTVIDTHIHLFDPTRPGGVPWPPASDATIYHAALPARYRAIAAPLGITGAIVVEASPLLEDNQWVLDVAARNPIIVGFVGDLDPGAPEFGRQLDRFRKSPLFRGIRYGNLWGRDLAADLAKPGFVEGLKLLAEAGLSLDTANPDARLLGAVLRVSDRVPGLRIVIDHLPNMRPPAGGADLQVLGERPLVYTKLSEVVRRENGRVITDVNYYRPHLDELTAAFGEDRVLYGSDWPNSDHVAGYPEVFGVVRDYFAGKSAAAREKYFWKNSVAAYRWRRKR